MSGDNTRFNLNAYKGDIAPFLDLLVRQNFCGFKTDTLNNKPRLVLFWATPSNEEGYNAFPAKLSAENVGPIIERWLSEQDYGREPDHDGDNGKGWSMWNDAWGHIEGHGWQACAAIAPEWQMYGK